MGVVVAKRLAQLLVVLWGVSTLVFFLTRVSGDPAAVVAGPNATAEQMRLVRASLGLDDSLPVQYWHFLADAVRLDFGQSFQSGRSAMALVVERLGPSAVLTGAAALFSLLVAVPLGIAAAVRRGSALSRAVLSVGVLLQSIPSFVLGIVLVLLFAVQLAWFPSIGNDGIKSIVLPVLTLSALLAARQTRLVYEYVSEELERPYVRTARANGFSERRIRVHHVMRNALIPLVTLFALDVAEFFAGAIITEQIFAWPGLGSLVVQSVVVRDYPVIQAAIIVIAVAVVAVNLIGDVLARAMDPRTRVSR